jgi:hypothetical protein
MGFVMGKEELGPVFSEYISFLCHQMLHTHLSSRAATVGQLMAKVPSEFSHIPPQKLKREKKVIFIREVICLNISRNVGYSVVFFVIFFSLCMQILS